MKDDGNDNDMQESQEEPVMMNWCFHQVLSVMRPFVAPSRFWTMMFCRAWTTFVSSSFTHQIL
jgi:hypothetical protein